jgi:hypothetical protein
MEGIDARKSRASSADDADADRVDRLYPGLDMRVSSEAQ